MQQGCDSVPADQPRFWLVTYIVPQFFGPFKSFNFIRQPRAINNAINRLEINWRRHLDELDDLGKRKNDVFVEYTLVYADNNKSIRPDAIVIRWWLNGNEKKMTEILNVSP